MKSRIWIVPLAFVLSGVIAVALAILMRPREEVSVQLGDGTVITLKRITYGKHHRYPPAGIRDRLNELVSKVLPGRSRSSPSLSNTTSNDTLTVWLEETSPAQGGGFGYRDYRLVDLARKSSTRPWWNSISSLSATQTLRGVGFENFPRRQDGALLCLMKSYSEPNRETPAAEFFVSNPGPKSFPIWSASSPPIAAKDGNLEFTLVECRNGVTRGGRGQRQPPSLDETYAKVAFRITEDGRPTTDWRPVGVESSDATGNRAANNNWSSTEEGGIVGMLFRDSLWSDEPAWKLRVEFSRAANYSPSERWTARPIDLSRLPARFSEIDPPISQTNLLGVTISLRGIEGGQSANDYSRLKVRVDPALKDARFTLVALTDENGGRIETRGSSFTSDGTTADYDFMLPRLGDIKTLTATFAVHRSRYAEFQVRPEN